LQIRKSRQGRSFIISKSILSIGEFWLSYFDCTEERLRCPTSGFFVTQNVGVTPAEACRQVAWHSQRMEKLIDGIHTLYPAGCCAVVLIIV
jgi:hypothetical protein